LRINLKFFGQLRELTGRSDEQIEVEPGAKIEELARVLAERFPKINKHLAVVSFSVNSEYVRKEKQLQDGDEVGLLPPISGG